MDPLTASLNSQLQMMGISDNNNTNMNQNVTVSIGNNFSMNVSSDNDNLPNDINLLRDILIMRVKYTRPKHGGFWEFNNVPSDINYLKQIINYIDKNCAQVQETKMATNYYVEYLEPLEMTPDELDDEFNVRFYEYLPYDTIRDNLLKSIQNSKYEYLGNILKYDRPIGQRVNKLWEIYQNNRYLTLDDYTLFYDRMDAVMREWILDYCDLSDSVYYRCNEIETTFRILKFIVDSQYVSDRIKLLIEKISEIEGSEEYLDENKGFSPFLTYVEHLQSAVEMALPTCQNPYKTAFLLMLVIKGMKKFPDLLSKFYIKLAELLGRYPDFTLGQLSSFLEENELPGFTKNDEILRLMS